MSIQSLPRTRSCRFLIALLALAFWPDVAATQADSAGAAPLNAHAKRYGGGWECDRGYRSVRRSCVAVEVPPNAYLDSLGHGWECNRGYREATGVCAKIEVPSNAFLNSNGSGWECHRGYRKVEQSCAADQPALFGPGSELVYAALWFMGNSFPGTMISGAGGRYPRALCGRIVL